MELRFTNCVFKICKFKVFLAMGKATKPFFINLEVQTKNTFMYSYLSELITLYNYF